jgi:hypothetical protein
MRTILLIAAASLILPVSAQQRPPRARGNPPMVHDVAPGQAAGGLANNITIRLQGTTTTGDGIDLELTGTGPSFSADQVVGEEQSILSCEYVVAEAPGGYRITYRIGMRVRVVTNTQKDSVNYEYRDVTINGSAVCAPGKPVAIVRNGGKPLEIVVSGEGPVADQKPAEPAEGE